MADFVLTQTDAQVQSVLNDAQDAQGAGAQTTLTTEYVMLKDTEGRYHKILKSSLTEACRNVLASLLVNNDKGTTISQIAAIASGDFGSVTPANLASVLGGLTMRSSSSASSQDSLQTTGLYKITGSSPDSIATDWGFLAVFGYDASHVAQVKVCVNLKKIGVRYYKDSAWSNFSEL